MQRLSLSIVFFFSLAVALLAPGCRRGESGPSAPAPEIIVSAAVSLRDAFTEIAALEERQKNIKVRFNFGASGALQKQIESGAPVDVFASAGAKQMDELAAKDLIIASSRADFARNSLVLITPANGLVISSLVDLSKPEVKKVAVGNPKTVPAGQYTEQALTHLKLLPEIQAKLILAEDVRQVLDYVARGEVDAGLVYSSDASNAGTKVKLAVAIPTELHDPILYPIAIMKDSHHAEPARKFIDLILSSEGQRILARHGFVTLK